MSAAESQTRAYFETDLGHGRSEITEAQARELCLSGRRVDAQEAQRCGLVNRVVADDELMQTALELATEIAESAGAATMKARFLESQPDLFG